MSRGELSGMGAVIFLAVMAVIAVVVVCIIAWCKIFRKAGIHPGFFFIPGYGMFLQYKIADAVGLFIATCVLAGVGEIGSFVMSAAMTNSYSSYSSYSSSSLGISGGALFFLGAICVAALIIQIMYSIKLAKAFGKGGGFAAGLIFLPVIFYPILGFGDAEYQGTYVHGGRSY